MDRRRALRIGTAVAALPMIVVTAPAGADDGGEADPTLVGRWGPAYQEVAQRCVTDADGRELCAPAAAAVMSLVNGRVLYWDALEGTENVNLGAIFEGAHETRNDRTRVLDVSGSEPAWRVPSPEDGGANPGGAGGEYLPVVPHDDPVVNDGDLFCSDQVQLPDGRILAVGGTNYYAEPSFGNALGDDYGVIELEGLHNARIFDPYTETWTQSGSMAYGRWYPSLVTLPSGDILVTSGVGKLIKPIYPDRPLDSGRNVVQTETYDVESGTWTTNAPTADRSLPLYPRLHLLPNGHVYYDAAGQVFNPMGQAYDEAFWNIAATYDPESQTWTDLGVPGTGLLDLGFRGSASSIMLPLEPDAEGRYLTADFLTAGGVLGVSPGTYLATDSVRIDRVDIDPATGAESLSTIAQPSLHSPRWYGTGVLAPTGEVLVFSGADRDEVVGPGTGVPVTTPELWDPATGEWTELAPQGRARTYHNTAMLLPDGRILVGGHAPIPTLYTFDTTLPGFSPNEGRDPSFEIYEPPYLFRGDRPTIAAAPGSVATGSTFEVTLGSAAEAADVASGGTVVLVRNTALTHLVDGDQRTVVLPVVSRDGATLVVQAPPDAAVAPAGPYLLFANRPTDDGLVPSVGAQVFVDAPVPPGLGAPLPAGVTGTEAPPVVPASPVAVLLENLQDAIGPRG